MHVEGSAASLSERLAGAAGAAAAAAAEALRAGELRRLAGAAAVGVPRAAELGAAGLRLCCRIGGAGGGHECCQP